MFDFDTKAKSFKNVLRNVSQGISSQSVAEELTSWLTARRASSSEPNSTKANTQMPTAVAVTSQWKSLLCTMWISLTIIDRLGYNLDAFDPTMNLEKATQLSLRHRDRQTTNIDRATIGSLPHPQLWRLVILTRCQSRRGRLIRTITTTLGLSRKSWLFETELWMILEGLTQVRKKG